ncbi:MAG: PAS domain S-box protein [Elusimicrobia bacterium]|nr:PAS domain S-box protein [Elusimicrobiota bacterium]
MDWSLRARVVAAMSLGLLLLCSASAVFYGRLNRFLETEDSVERAQSTLAAAQVLLTALADVETAQRAFVLTGDRRYRERHDARAAAVAPALRRLRVLVDADPSQRRRVDALEPLVAAKLRWLARLGRLRAERGFPAALEAFRTGVGTSYMDQIRIVSGEIQAQEDATLAARQALSRDDARATIGTMGALILCALLLKVGWAVVIERGMRRREAAEASLVESERLLSSLLEAAPDPIVIADSGGRIVLVNAQVEAVFGYAKPEILGRPVETLVPERFREAHVRHRADYARSPGRRMGAGRELSAVRKDGVEFAADITLSPLRTTRGDWAIAIVRDITERKAAQDAVRAGQERLDQALESARMGAWELDLRTDRSVRTLRHDQIFGYDALQAEWGVGRFVAEHVVPEHRELVERALAQARQDGHFRLECRIARRDGAERWIRAEGRVFRDEGGEPARMVGVVADVTDEKEKEDALRAANSQLEAANKELETFSYSVSHDLRAALRAIDGFSKAVMEDCAGKLDAESLESLSRVRAASQRMAQLIDDILELSRVSRVELRREPVDLSAVAEGIVADLRKADPSRAVEVSVAAGLVANGDPRLLRLVLLNLLDNAWKFTSRSPAARLEFSSFREPDGSAAYYVRDNGAGFDPAFAGKLFGVFQRLHEAREYPGTGVGLATCQRIVRRHGGRIWAEGAVGQGATFYFTV